MDRADRIHLRDYIVTAEIGAFQSERGNQQRLRFNLTVELAHPVTEVDDQVDRILSYDVLTQAIATGLADRRYDLLETLAEKIAAEVLVHPAAARIEVGIEKLDRVPGALGVTISRDAAQVVADGDTRRPTILFVAAGQPVSLTDPVVIVPDAPSLPLPPTGDRRRLALLAMDQAAWALAGQLGLDVADSRTEIDWSIRAGLPLVWAPYRMTADIADLPPDPTALTFWLAARLNAARVEFALPSGQPLPAPPPGYTIDVTRCT